MIPLTNEQKDLYNKATNCDWRKKEFNDDYYCNKCYEKLDSETTCHEKKYLMKDEQSLVDEENQVRNIYENALKIKMI